MPRTYTEKEIAALLQRTAQLQAEEAESKEGAREGLSLDELEVVARDAGLDPQLLHRAALEMAHSGGRSLGKNRTNTHVRVDRFLAGELSEDEWEEVIFALRRRFESESLDMTGMGSFGKGKIEQIGRSREWRHTSISGVQTSVLFRPQEGGTRMEISQRVGMASPKVEAWAYGTPFAFLFSVISGAVAKSVLIGGAAALGWMVFLVPLIYFLDTRWREKKHDKLAELADELQQIAMRDERASLTHRTTSRSAEVTDPFERSASDVRLDFSDEEAETDPSTLRSRGSRTL